LPEFQSENFKHAGQRSPGNTHCGVPEGAPESGPREGPPPYACAEGISGPGGTAPGPGDGHSGCVRRRRPARAAAAAEENARKL